MERYKLVSVKICVKSELNILCESRVGDERLNSLQRLKYRCVRERALFAVRYQLFVIITEDFPDKTVNS